MIIISKKQVIAMHHVIILRTGGSYGLRDKNMLESALTSPFQTFDSQELFPSFEEKAARLGFGLVSNHAFIDGNKRIAAHTNACSIRIKWRCLNLFTNRTYQHFSRTCFR